MALTFAVIATAAAVIFYVMWSKSLEEHDTAVADAAKLANDSDMRALSGIAPTISESSTAVSQLIAEINALKDERDTANRNLSIERNNLQNAVSARNAQEAAARQYQSQFDQATREVRTARTDFNDESSKLRDNMSRLNAQIAAVGADRDRAIQEAQNNLNIAIDEAERARRETVRQLEDAQSQIARLSADVFDLRQRIQNLRGKTDVNVGEPDGRVVRVNGATGEVYINLGKPDRVTPGMPFTAYDPRTGVRFGSDEAAAGNGSIEVMTVGDDTSLCRITRTSTDRAIQAGDLISNIVYHNDRTRKFRFTVFGDFDLDGDGIYTAAERDRLIVLIKRWGGEVDDDVSSQTDYLVLGAKPKAPLIQQEPPPTEATDEAAVTDTGLSFVGGVADARTQDQARYEELEIAAKRLAIPVLNANRFLAMVGYYNTTVVRY